MSLVIAPCSRKAAEHAVMRWHYSRQMPRTRLVTFGVWEDDEFTGAVILGHGATSALGKPYGLEQAECAELLRVALREHKTPVTQVIAQCLRLLKKGSPGLRLIISFADPGHGHHGGIYQAGNWVYTGKTGTTDEYIVHGRRFHGRAISYRVSRRPMRAGETRLEYIRRTMDPNAQKIQPKPKHRYLYPLDRAMRRRVAPLARPYPAAEASMVTRPASGEERQVQALQAAL